MNIAEKIIFGSKWLLVPFYLVLVVALFVYMGIDIRELYHLASTAWYLNEEGGMMMLLKLVDMVMVANLVKMIITGSYSTFVRKHEEEGKTSSGVLKVKMATSLIGVSAINLLQTFINASTITTETLNKQIFIHVMFLVGALVLAVIEYLHVKAEAVHHEDEDKHPIKKT